jgi:cytidylate kinase
MEKPIDIPGIRIITVSGRIATGATTLAQKIADHLGWSFWEGGALVEKFYKEELHGNETDTTARPDSHELWFDNKLKEMIKNDSHAVVQSHLAGFFAQDISDVYKVCVVCEEDGEDKQDVRIDRLVNRKNISVDDAKKDVRDREAGNLEKWRRLYVNSDPQWVYWDKKYYDLMVNSFSHNQDESLELLIDALKVR